MKNSITALSRISSYALLAIVILMAIAIAARITPHIPNIAPVAALSLFAAFLGRSWIVGAVAALIVMAISDLFVGVYDWRIQASVYACISLYALFGPWLTQRSSRALVPASLMAALAGGLAFFIITNFTVWAFGTMYPHTLAGLIENYTMALPFYRATLLGDLMWTGFFFGCYSLLNQFIAAPKAATSN